MASAATPLTLAPARKPAIEFPRRAKRYTTATALVRRFNSSDGRFAVCEVRSLFGLPLRVLAIRRTAHGEHVISRHRKLRRAFESCRISAFFQEAN